MKILSIFGTRPEAIKMAPLVLRLGVEPGIHSIVCVTGQHRTLLQQVLNEFGIVAHHDLGIMVPNQTLNELTSRLFAAMDTLLDQVKPDRVLVHGDTTTAMVAAVAAFQRRIPVAHVEAGLRTHDIAQPRPEEMNRRFVDVVSDMLFAPTQASKDNLDAERLAGRIHITGNTVIDALQLSVGKIAHDGALRARLDAQLPVLLPEKKLLLVTGHRRENFGAGFENLCSALRALSRRPDIQIVYPVHLNPNVRAPVLASLSDCSNVHLIEPLGYLQFVRLMQQAHVILTDSGGIQEEAPSLGKPVLVLRDVTERPEAVAAGTVRLVGTDAARIVSSVNELFDDGGPWHSYALRHNPYGDGHAAERIVSALKGEPFKEFCPERQVERTAVPSDGQVATILVATPARFSGATARFGI
jgi:UDP-N-acetylglucosamine 2-epimerase (non-hydrolysing)